MFSNQFSDVCITLFMIAKGVLLKLLSVNGLSQENTESNITNYETQFAEVILLLVSYIYYF